MPDAELAAADFDLSLTGFDRKELDDLLLRPDDPNQPDSAPLLSHDPVSRLGNLWLFDNGHRQHRFCADATDPQGVGRLPGER